MSGFTSANSFSRSSGVIRWTRFSNSSPSSSLSIRSSNSSSGSSTRLSGVPHLLFIWTFPQYAPLWKSPLHVALPALSPFSETHTIFFLSFLGIMDTDYGIFQYKSTYGYVMSTYHKPQYLKHLNWFLLEKSSQQAWFEGLLMSFDDRKLKSK